MRCQQKRPTAKQLEQFISLLPHPPYSYPEIGASDGYFPEGYRHSNDRFYLGEGQAIWERACTLIRTWQMFPKGWTFVHPANPPKVGREVAVCFRQFGLWWKNACRIVYTHQEKQRYGFAYGTLTTHVGSGEEYFGVERDEAGNCWFVLKAFSLPQYWGAQLFPWYMRAQQRAFINQSGQQMQQLVQRPQAMLA